MERVFLCKSPSIGAPITILEFDFEYTNRMAAEIQLVCTDFDMVV
jgi:hypothetical protein